LILIKPATVYPVTGQGYVTLCALRRTGFDVIVGFNLDKAGMDDVFVRFARAAHEAAEISCPTAVTIRNGGSNFAERDGSPAFPSAACGRHPRSRFDPHQGGGADSHIQLHESVGGVRMPPKVGRRK
jgi:hypothetical protein